MSRDVFSYERSKVFTNTYLIKSRKRMFNGVQGEGRLRIRIGHEVEHADVRKQRECGASSAGGGVLFRRLGAMRRSGRVQNVIFSLKAIVNGDRGRRVNGEDIELVWRQDSVDITRRHEGIIDLKVRRRKTPRAPNR